MLYKALVTLASLVFGFAIISAAVYWQLEYGERSGGGPRSDPGATPVQSSFTLDELAEHDGQNGNECYVAVDGEVYLIEEGLRAVVHGRAHARHYRDLADLLREELDSGGRDHRALLTPAPGRTPLGTDSR